MNKIFKINKSLIITSLILALTSCVFTGERSATREPAQVSDAQKFKSPNVQNEINQDELIWLELKTPNIKEGKKNEKMIVFDREYERMYLQFISTFGLTDTLEVRTRFYTLPLKPLSDVEINYLENSPQYRLQLANSKKATQSTSKVRRDLFKRSQQVATKTAKGTRINVTRGKPSSVGVTYWIAADVATALQKQGINFEDTVFYFKTFGFRSLVTGKKIHPSDLHLRYRDYGSQGRDYVELTAAEIERIKTFSGILVNERSKILVDMIKRGAIIDEKLEKVLIANGFGAAEIAAAKDENNPTYKEAYRQGKAFNNIYEKHILTMTTTLAKIQAEKDMGYLSDSEYRAKFNEEKAATDKLYNETKNGWSAAFASGMYNIAHSVWQVGARLATKDYVGVSIPVMFDSPERYAKDEVARVINTYGSIKKYEEFLKGVEEKYKYRPNARAAERMFRFFEGIPRTIGNAIAFVDVAREISPVPLTPIDYYNKITGQKFVAKDGNFYKANEAIHEFVKNSRPENTDFNEEFWVAVAPQVISQMTVQIGAGLITGGGSAIIGTMTSVGMGVAQSGTETYKAAVAANASEQHRLIAARVGAMTGLIDILPMGRFFGAVKTPALRSTMWKTFIGSTFTGLERQVGSEVALGITKGIVARQMMQYGSKILVGQITEGVTELTQERINSLVAKMTYDPKRNTLFISPEEMQAFWGGVVGGTFGGGFQITLQRANDLQAAAIESEVGQVASLFAMMKVQDSKDAATAAQTAERILVPIMILERQMATAAKSTRQDPAFVTYRQQLIAQQNALLSRADTVSMSPESKKFIESKLKENQEQQAKINKEAAAQQAQQTKAATQAQAAQSQQPSTTGGNLDFIQNRFDASLVATLKQKANEVIWNKVVNDTEFAQAFVDVLNGHPHLQKNVETFLIPADSRRRTFFNQMMQKVVDSKVEFIRQQMIENTRRVLEQPDCGM